MANTVTETGGGGIDLRDFKAVAQALRHAQPELAKQVREELRAAGEIAAERARSLAEEHSKTIKPTIKTRVYSNTVSIVAGGGDVAIAGLFELGNTGGRKSAAASARGKFRHPVFGNKGVWVDQDMHPYLRPAGDETMPAVEAGVLRALDHATEIIVFEE